ncbi:MAG TPA: hypothetical protein VGA85_04475 [Dehalococcoidales bacterium]
MKHVYLYCILAVILIGMSACTDNSADKTQPESYFPVQKEAAEEVMQALLPGKLVIDDAGYLRVNVTNDFHPLIIWPYGYSLKIEGKETWIINDKGQAVARVGDTVILGGGEVPAWAVEEIIGYALPEDAKGPYWTVGKIRNEE